MPELHAAWIGSVPLGLVSLFFLCRLLWQQISHKTVKPSLAAAHLLTGAGSIWNNPIFIALACSRIYAPNLLLETLYNGALQTICLFVVRLVSILLCLALWNHLYTTGHSNVNSYVKCRYHSSWINLLYNINTLFGFSYMIKLEAGPTGYGFADFLVAGRLMPFLIIFWLIVTSLGGFEITMLALAVIWLTEMVGHVGAALKVPKFQLWASEVDSWTVNGCVGNLGLPSFVIIFFQMMTVLPFYRLYRAAGTRARGNFAIGLSIVFFAIDQFWALLETSAIHSLSAKSNISHEYRIRAAIAGFGQSGKLSADSVQWQDIESQDISQYTKKLWNLDPLGGCFLFGPVIGHYKAYLVIQLHLMTCHVLENLLPAWLAEGLYTSYQELRVLYSCIRILLSTFIFIQITRSVHSIGSADLRGILFYLPLLPSMLTVTVGTFLVLGLVQKILKATVVVPMTVIQLAVSVFVLGLFSFAQNEEDFVTHRRIWSQGFQSMTSFRMCGIAWFPTVLALFFALIMMTLAVMLQVPATGGALKAIAGKAGKDDEKEEGEGEGGGADGSVDNTSVKINGDRGLAGSVGDFTGGDP